MATPTSSRSASSFPRGRPGSRAAYVAVLLVGTLILSGVLAYQVVDANRSHENVAKKTVGEQAGVAAWAYTGAARRFLLDKLMWPAVDVVGRSGGKEPEIALVWDTVAVRAEEKEWAYFEDVRFIFRADLETGKVAYAGYPTSEAKSWLQKSVEDWARGGVATGAEPILVVPPSEGRAPVVYATYPESPDPVRFVYGAGFHPTVLAVPLGYAFSEPTLLPAALTGGIPNAELFSCTVTTPAGEKVFSSGEHFTDEFVGTDTLGIRFAGLTTEVRIRPELARTLVIGGFPRSRLPLVLGLMALTGGLVLAAIFQLKREGELARLRADFVSGVSHELRTPLAQIRMFAETLALSRVRSEEERARSLDIIVNESQRLSHQVDNVLLFSRSERGRMRLERAPADLPTVVREVLEGFDPLARAAGVTIRAELNGALRAEVDAAAIKQVLLNLLDNAVKYGPKGQTVRVGASRFPGGRALLWVEDEGPGVPEDMARDIFEPYSRLEAHRESAVAGSGIGLAVAREIVRGHGGEIWVEDGSEGGARFLVTLPAEANGAAQG